MDLGSHGGREGDLSWYLAAVVGAAEFLGDDVEETRTLPMTPEIGLGDPHVWRGLFLRCLKTLLVPDLAGQRVAVIESRRYTKLATEEFVAGEYYRYFLFHQSYI